MKHKFSLIWRVAVALVLVLSFSLVAAVPVVAAPSYADCTLIDIDAAAGTATWSTDAPPGYSGSYSVKLASDPENAGAAFAVPYAVRVPYGKLLSTITSEDVFTWKYCTEDSCCSFGVLYIDSGGGNTVDYALLSNSQGTLLSDGAWHETTAAATGTPAWNEYNCAGNGADVNLGYIGENWNTLTYWKGQHASATLLYVGVAWGTIADTTIYVDDITIESTTYDLGAASFVNASDLEIETVPSDGTFYLYAESAAWNASEFVENTGQVTLKVYSVYTGGTDVLVSTTVYTATESGKNTGHFRTPAISGADLSLKPGYKLVAGCPGGATDNSVDYAAAKVSFDKSIYSIDEEMVLTVEDDSLNTVATTPLDTITVAGTVTKLDINEKGGGTTGNLTLTETGIDTGIFQLKVTPNDAEAAIWCNSAMDFAYTNTNTTTGAGTGGSHIITKTAYVSPSSPSSVAFDPSTIGVTATSVEVVVIDRDESDDPSTIDDAISGAVVVKSLAADDSVIDSLTVPALTENTTAGRFVGTVTFGSGATQLDVTGAAKLQATYTDPNDSADVSTAIGVIGTTVDLLDATGAVKKSFTTITDAEKDALVAANYTILVKSGYASGDETWPVTINAATGLTIKAEDGAAVVLDPWLASGASGIFVVDIGSVTIEGLTLKHSKSAVDPVNLVLVQGAGDSLTVKDCTFDLTAGAADDTGISFADAVIAGVVVNGCTFNVGATATAIESTLNDGVVFDVKNCTFTGSSGIGLKLTDAGTAAAIPVGVTSNTFDGLANALVIAQSNTTFVEVKWNTITNSAWVAPGTGAIEISNAPAVSIVGNDIKDNAGYSVWVKTGASDDDVDVVFNNITGNTKVLKTEDTAGVKLNAKHNWWGHTTAPTTSDVSSLTYVDTTYYLTAAAKLTAEYTEAANGLFDKHLTTGVKVSATGTGAADADVIGVAEYAESPKAELSGASFYDVFVATYGTDGTSNVTIQFYTPGISADSVVYFWNSLAGEWQACSNRGYNSYDEYIWVLAKDQTVTVPTYPTIQELVGGMFAISTVPVRTLESIAVTPATASIGVGGTQQFTATGTYNLAPLTEDITTEVTWASSVLGVATIDAAGLATGVAVGTTNITATLDTIVSEPAVLTVSIWDPMVYDEDEDGVMEIGEVLTAISDYFAGEITITQVLEVIALYF